MSEATSPPSRLDAPDLQGADPLAFPAGFGLVWIVWADEPMEIFRAELWRFIAESVPILLVHPSSARAGYIGGASRMLRRGVPQPRSIGSRLYQLDVPLIPGGSNRALRNLNHREVARVTRAAMDQLGITTGAVIFDFPWWYDVAAALSDRAVPVYDCPDFFPGFHGLPAEWLPELERCETEILSRDFMVMVASDRLRDRFKAMNPNAEVVVADAAFTRDHLDDFDLPPLSRPVLMLSGWINARYDFALLKRCLEEIPGASLVLAGHVGVHAGTADWEAVEWLREHGAVITGKLSHRQIRGLARQADVGLMPYLQTPMNHYARPAKLFDFLGAGVPVVSTDVPDLGDCERWVRIARSDDDFIAGVRAAALHGRLDSGAMRGWADQHTDEAAAARVLSILVSRWHAARPGAARHPS